MLSNYVEEHPLKSVLIYINSVLCKLLIFKSCSQLQDFLCFSTLVTNYVLEMILVVSVATSSILILYFDLYDFMKCMFRDTKKIISFHAVVNQ